MAEWIRDSIVIRLILAIAVIAWIVWLSRRTTGSLRSGEPTWHADRFASDGTPIPAEISEALSQVTSVKAAALKNAAIQAHRAYFYHDSNFPNDEACTSVAIDIGVQGYTQDFKIWDLDIIDGETNENYGSDPDVAFLDSQGNFIAFDGDEIDFTKPIRLLLIYRVPLITKTVKLGYWGQDLVLSPLNLEPTGPTLPERA